MTPMVWGKYFDPFSQWTWYVLEAEDQGDDVLFYGYVVGTYPDLRYFRLSDVADITSPEGECWHSRVSMVRDSTFTPCPLSEVRRLHQKEASGA